MNEKLGVTTLAGVFGLVVAVIYLIAYWGSFSFDVFQFAGLTDFVKLAIFPLALTLFAHALSVTITSLLTPTAVKSRLDRPGKWPPPTIYRVVLSVAMVGIVLVQALVHAQWRWLVTLTLVCVPFSTLMIHPRVQRLMPGYVLRFNFLMLSLLFPVFAAMIGSIHAQVIKSGNSSLIVDNTGIAAGLKATPDHPLSYVGFVSDTFFVFETATGNLILLKQSDSAPLVLKPNPKYRNSNFRGLLN